MNLEEQIANLNPEAFVADLLRAVCSARGVETAREASYIGVRPQDRNVAAYFNRRFVDIAVDPSDSAAAAARVQASRVLPKTRATHYVRVDGADLHQEAVPDEILHAVSWREHGPRWAGGSGSGAFRDLAGEVCGTCNLAITPAGSCGCD